MTDKSIAVRSPPKRSPRSKTQAAREGLKEALTLVSQSSVYRRYCLHGWADTCIPIPQQGSSILHASSINMDAPVKKMLQPMWKAPLPAQEFCRFWEEDWPRLRAIRIQALKGCFATLRSVDSAAIALLKDKLYEAHQCFSAEKLARDNEQAMIRDCQRDALRDAALLGHAGQKILDPLACLSDYPTQKLSSHSSGWSSVHTDLDILEQRVFRLHKQLFFRAFHLRVVYTKNVLRLSSAVILDNDNYMLLRGTLLTWHRLLYYKRCLTRIDILVSNVLSTFIKRKYLDYWLSSLHTHVAVRKEKVLRRLLYDSIGVSNTSYPEPSIFSSPSVAQPEQSGAARGSSGEAYLTRLYNIFIAIGTPLTPQNRSVLSLTDFSIVIGLISKLSRIRRKVRTVSGLGHTRHSREGIHSFTALGEVLQSAKTATALEAFGATYYNNILMQRVFSNLRNAFFLHTLHNLALIYSAYTDKSRIIRVLSMGLNVQQRRIFAVRTKIILRVSFSHLCHAYTDAITFKYNQSDQLHNNSLVSIAWKNIYSLAKRYTKLNALATDLIERSVVESKRNAFDSLKLAHTCNVFMEQHINNKRNFRYRRVFWLMHRVAFQRKALRRVMWCISFPCYRRLIQIESYHASRTYQRDICRSCLHHWREISLQNQKALAMRTQVLRADAFYNQKLTRFVMHLLLIKTKQKQESRLFFYRRQILLVRTAFRQWNIRLHRRRNIDNLRITLKTIMELYEVKFVDAIVTELFYRWRSHARARYFHGSVLQRQAFHALCSASVSVKYLHVSDRQYRRSLMRRAYSILIVFYQYQRFLAKLDRKYEHTLKRIGFFTLRSKYIEIAKSMERADMVYQRYLLFRVCKALEYVAVKSRVYMYAHTVGTRYIKFFYLRRWKLSLRASREAIYLEKRADSFYKRLLERWADQILRGSSMKTDIPVSCLLFHTNKELLETGLLGSIVLSSKVLKAHLLYENQLLLAAFDEWRYAVIRRQRLISMRGPI